MIRYHCDRCGTRPGVVTRFRIISVDAIEEHIEDRKLEPGLVNVQHMTRDLCRDCAKGAWEAAAERLHQVRTPEQAIREVAGKEVAR